jgi:CrcB protein
VARCVLRETRYAAFTPANQIGMEEGVSFLLVFLGAALGGMLRYAVMTATARWAGESFPWGTLAVNLGGSFLLGLVLASGLFTGEAGYLAATGFCGGLTTFSTFSLQTLTLVSEGRTLRVAANIGGSIGLCLLGLAAGYSLGGGA